MVFRALCAQCSDVRTLQQGSGFTLFRIEGLGLRYLDPQNGYHNCPRPTGKPKKTIPLPSAGLSRGVHRGFGECCVGECMYILGVQIWGNREFKPYGSPKPEVFIGHGGFRTSGHLQHPFKTA